MTRRLSLSQQFIFATIAGLFLLVAAQADPLPRGAADVAGFAPAKLENIPAAIKKAVDEKKIAGGAALVARRGKVIHFSTVGLQDIEGKVPAGETTIYRIASMSKPITSVAAMILVDDGKLNVTDPLSRFVPEFKDMKVLVPSQDGKSYELVKANREITLHDLLTHTSGISYRLFDKPFLGKLYAEAGVSDGIVETPGTISDNVRKLAKMPLACQPGGAWEYGLNTDVLGYVVEVVSGKSLEQFCRDRIFQPLQMKDTCFVLQKDKHPRLASLYAVGPEKSLKRVGSEPITVGGTVYNATFPTREGSQYYSGGGGLVSTIPDYFRFAQMMLNKGELDGVRILKPETVERMTKNQIGATQIPFGNTEMGYGFGMVNEKTKASGQEPSAIGSYGWGGAFGTSFWVDPKNEVIGIFMTQAFPPDFTVANDVKRLTYEAFTAGTK